MSLGYGGDEIRTEDEPGLTDEDRERIAAFLDKRREQGGKQVDAHALRPDGHFAAGAGDRDRGRGIVAAECAAIREALTEGSVRDVAGEMGRATRAVRHHGRGECDHDVSVETPPVRYDPVAGAWRPVDGFDAEGRPDIPDDHLLVTFYRADASQHVRTYHDTRDCPGVRGDSVTAVWPAGDVLDEPRASPCDHCLPRGVADE
jgi:hypothetical protein